MPEITAAPSASPATFSDQLPLRLIKSQAIPPCPNRSDSGPTIDWLPNFAGYSWIAYGASSLLVISHLPDPFSDTETQLGPVFRQVLKLSDVGAGNVSAVSWSPSSPSAGDLAAALDNCIGVFSYGSETSPGAFCWTKTAILVQSTKVEAIKWTGSGDGIISGGIEVVLWRKKDRYWEIAWKFKPELPQTLVSATWSIEGSVATASLTKLGDSSYHLNPMSKYVTVSQKDTDSKYFQAELHHPQPISLIQWRPSTVKQLKKDAGRQQRLVLLTCCLDGAVRLWSEIDDGRIRKSAKESNDPKMTKLDFRVIAVVEVNHALKGTLGHDVLVQWMADIDGMANIGEQASQYACSKGDQPDQAGKCDWLVGFGPQAAVTLWAVHCLDDFSPLRFPRVTLWKMKELNIHHMESSRLLIGNVFINRNQVFSPPTSCYWVELLPRNLLVSLRLFTHASDRREEGSTNEYKKDSLLSSCAKGTLNIDGHSGKILQVAVHPSLCEIGVAASLDTKGVLFWSFSMISNSMIGLPTIGPSWKLSGNFSLSDPHPKYTSLGWAPTMLNGDLILFMGHHEGVDCLIVKTFFDEEEEILCHNLCTIGFPSQWTGQGPDSVCLIPLPSTCDKTFVSNNFLLFSVWKNGFLALSRKISIHHYDSPGSSCHCSFDIGSNSNSQSSTFEGDFLGRQYQVSVDPCSSLLPPTYNSNKFSSYSLISLHDFVLSGKMDGISTTDASNTSFSYHLVTGCIDGCLKLWRSVPATSMDLHWDLVGMLEVHQGPITAVAVSPCGQRIATVSSGEQANDSSTVHIWQCLHLGDAGSFVLEDTLHPGAEVVSLKWMTIGNGLPILGVCLRNELQLYALRRCGGQYILKSEKMLERNIWVCIAVNHEHPAFSNFLWGPKAMGFFVHEEYFGLFSPILLLEDKKFLTKSPVELHNDKCISVFADTNDYDTEYPLNIDKGQESQSRSHMKVNVRGCFLSTTEIKSSILDFNSSSNFGFWSMSEVAEKLGGSLPVFHPEALLINISAGHWRRAYAALQYLVEIFASNDGSLEERDFLKMSGNSIPPVPLLKYLEGIDSPSSNIKSFQWKGNPAFVTKREFTESTMSWGYDPPNNAGSSPRSEGSNLMEALEKSCESGLISITEKAQIHSIIDLLQEVSDPQSSSAYESLDEPGKRFWVAVRFQQLYFNRKFSRRPLAGDLVVHSGLIGWAFHSESQENLFSSLLPAQPSWLEMRDIGVGFWYTDAVQLRLKMEKLARQRYLENKDPKACALLYIALNRIQVLAGLFKISKDDKDKPLVAFLSRNFQEDKNKAAALKNAYVLLGRHQLELAIAFFLLGGDTSSAVNVCVKNLGDEQLALVICRLVEGYGGPLEHYLISKFLLPSTYEKGDYWLASLFEWLLGNYSLAFLRMLGFQIDFMSNKSILSSNQDSFLDPSIGQYCLMLTTKTPMKKAIGEQNAAVIRRWAVLMIATALRRCGLPLEAMERLSSSLSMSGGSVQNAVADNAKTDSLENMMMLFAHTKLSNWISNDVTFNIECQTKLDLSMQYVSQLLRQHPTWLDIRLAIQGAHQFTKSDDQECKRLENFQDTLTAVLTLLHKKFSSVPSHLISMTILYLCNNGYMFIGYSMLYDFAPRYFLQEEGNGLDVLLLYPVLPNLLLKVTKEVLSTVSSYIASCCISCYDLKCCSNKNSTTSKDSFGWMLILKFYRYNVIWALHCLKARLKQLYGSCKKDFMKIPLHILDLSEYFLYFASAWLHGDVKGLCLTVKPLSTICSNHHTSYEIDKRDLSTCISEIAKMLESTSLGNDLEPSLESSERIEHWPGEDIMPSIPENNICRVSGASLWWHISDLLEHQLSSLPEKLEDPCSFQFSCELHAVSTSTMTGPDNENIATLIDMLTDLVVNLLKVTCRHISLYCAKQFAFYLLQKGGVSGDVTFLCSTYSQSQCGTKKTYHSQDDSTNILNRDSELSTSVLQDICADPKIILGSMKENSRLFQHIKTKSRRWSDMYISIRQECVTDEDEDGVESPSGQVGSPVLCLSPNDHIFQSLVGDDTNHSKKVLPFHNPKEVCKRNGELLEAMCINSIDQHQAALASNKKGIVFFHWVDEIPHGDLTEYIWSEADWPHNGWAGSESTPVPTCVSPGVGLGSKKGTHLGLGGATVGAGSLARPGRDFARGGGFGVKGYTGMGTSGFGWGIQEDFDELVDPPATMDNVRTRAFSAHPSRPFFLVGSSNTHIYLWEFGKDKATATYGVLPAANVPPPYALASISSVQFDQCGHRFVTAASDGTVCTWQLEVGGRSNIRPTESCVCFSNYTSDVTYITASGSIVAAAGYNSSGVNVVIWDTLAPQTTSRASIMCHEGGACSLSVFDNDIGSGSISPLIVTGGKGGDVGLHDFRYIATGRTKKHRSSDSSDQNMSASSAVDSLSKTGDQNRNGMLWYIPKAHAGTVTKITTIPNTSFFLTGSIDGDVKLWDAKMSKLVYHWPKLHERHTFLQPSSRGFGGVVRAAVTDIQVVSCGFLSCGGDGSVKLIELNNFNTNE